MDQVDELDDDDPLWLVDKQIHGASEDHEDVIAWLTATGLPPTTVKRMHRALCNSETGD